STDRSTERGRVCGRVQRAASPAGFDDNGGQSQSADQSIPGQKAPLGRRYAECDLADDCARIADSCEQLRMTCGITSIDTTGDERDGGAADAQCGAMRRSVDAVRPA